MFGKTPVLVIEHHAAIYYNTADFHIGQDQNDGVKETKLLGVVSKSENLVPGHHKKNRREL